MHPIALVVFDVLNLEGTTLLHEPYWKRREILDSLELAGPHWSTVPSFAESTALWTVVEAQALEGLVAKRPGGLISLERAAG